MTLLVAVSAASAGSAVQRTKVAAGPIEALAMDGSRVAFDVQGNLPRRCNRVYVWNVRTGATTLVSGKGTCGADNSSTGAGVRELAVAGSRVAWIANVGGNSESDDYLYAASVPNPRERRLGFARRSGEVGGLLGGNWLGGLVGGGSFLGVDGWETNAQGQVVSANLRSIGSGLRTIASGTDTLYAASTDGKEIAVRGLGNAVRLYATSGRLLRTVSTLRAPSAVALRGDYLAVLTRARTLEVYNAHSGRRLHSWRVAPSARWLDLSSGYAVYAATLHSGGSTRVIHFLRLATGRDRVVATTPAELGGVQLEPAGLVYAVNPPSAKMRPYLVFRPMRLLLR